MSNLMTNLYNTVVDGVSQSYTFITDKLSQGYNYVRNSLNTFGFFNRNQPLQNQHNVEDRTRVNKSYISEVTERRYMGTSINYRFIISKSTESYMQDLKGIFLQEKVVKQKLNEYFQHNGSFTLYTDIMVRFVKETENEPKYIEHGFVMPKHPPFTDISMINDYLKQAKLHFANRIEEHEGRGSGLQYHACLRMTMKIRRYDPSTNFQNQRGSSHIKLPEKLIRKLAYVNVRNTNNECFKYAITSALHPAKYQSERVSHYEPYLNEVNWSTLTFPVRLNKKHFEKFEQANPSLPPLNVHVLEKYTNLFPFPFYSSCKDANAENAINLMYFQRNEDTTRIEANEGHYVWIKHLSRALSKLTQHNGKKHICARCYTPWTSRERLDIHDKECSVEVQAQIKEMPHCNKHTFNMKTCLYCKEARTCKFKDYRSKQTLPLVIYFDCEALNRKIKVAQPEAQRIVNGKTKVVAEQDLMAVGMYCSVADYYKPYFPDFVDKYESFVGEMAVIDFIKALKKNVEDINQIIQSYYKPIEEFIINPKEVKKCHICELDILSGKKIVRDHCHFSGKFRGYAHNECNINYNLKNIPIKVVSHNFKGYDKSILLAMKHFPEIKCEPIMENTEKPKCVNMTWVGFGETLVKCQFMDSYMHMSQKLETLIQNQTHYPQPLEEFSERGAKFMDFAKHV
jgi:hypothetical protein